MGNAARAPLSLSSALAVTRKIWVIMLASIPLLVGAIELLNPPPRHSSQSLTLPLAVLAGFCMFSWLSFGQQFLRKARLQLAQDSNDTKAVKKWQAGYIILFTLSEAVALYGVNLRFLGSTFHTVAPFYLAGLALMIFSAPKGLGAGPSRK